MEAWNLKQLQQAKLVDLENCRTKLERSMCETIRNKDIRELAKKILLTRKLTPGEQSILDSI